MPNTTLGPGTKKETVYSGPGPQAKPGAASGVSPRPGSTSNGMPPGTTGSMYSGPAGGTVYNGPTGGAVYGGPGVGGTVYNPRQATSPATVAGSGPAAVKGANLFFAIAIFSALNTVLVLAGVSIVSGSGVTTSKAASPGAMTGLVVINIVIVGIFVLLGIAARSGSKAAFIIGMVLYGGDTAMLLISGHPELHIAGIVVHAILLIGLFNTFRQLQN
ncbi:MAG TPA: hypothetical protein VH724_12890 [Candidatus Angelobacter sp.]|nr:hypothetical protein [Candidatus Angelobacter sp.]